MTLACHERSTVLPLGSCRLHASVPASSGKGSGPPGNCCRNLSETRLENDRRELPSDVGSPSERPSAFPLRSAFLAKVLDGLPPQR